MVCAKCGADAVIPRAILMDQGQGSQGALTVKVERHPEALFFKDASLSPLVARVCGLCGYTELYADSPEELYKAYQDFLQASKEKARHGDAS
jgi:predicted nucleic-acid-binding Zn-ribbon protein